MDPALKSYFEVLEIGGVPFIVRDLRFALIGYLDRALEAYA